MCACMCVWPAHVIVPKDVHIMFGIRTHVHVHVKSMPADQFNCIACLSESIKLLEQLKYRIIAAYS